MFLSFDSLVMPRLDWVTLWCSSGVGGEVDVVRVGRDVGFRDLLGECRVSVVRSWGTVLWKAIFLNRYTES